MYPKRDIYCLCWSLNQGPLAYQSSHSTERTEESTHYPEPGKESNVLQEIPDQKTVQFSQILFTHLQVRPRMAGKCSVSLYAMSTSCIAQTLDPPQLIVLFIDE